MKDVMNSIKLKVAHWVTSDVSMQGVGISDISRAWTLADPSKVPKATRVLKRPLECDLLP